jgi:hypothetical protein
MNYSVERRSTFFRNSFYLVPPFCPKVAGVLHPKLNKIRENL